MSSLLRLHDGMYVAPHAIEALAVDPRTNNTIIALASGETLITDTLIETVVAKLADYEAQRKAALSTTTYLTYNDTTPRGNE